MNGERKYILGKELGRGGLGRVLEAEDAAVGRIVALKLLLDGAPLELVQRFRREGQITARLEHPNIVPVHDVGALPGTGEIFFAMKKIAGRDMGEVIDGMKAGKGEWTQRRLVEAFRDACRGVAFAHSRGVIHRDLKPSNIMLGEFGEVLVVDWGLAKEQGERAKGREDGALPALSPIRPPALTLDGDVMGTPEYMPPEQAAGNLDDVDERSDVYALGAILYEILTWRPPFTGASTTEVLRRVVSETPARPSSLVLTRAVPAGAAPGTPLPPPSARAPAGVPPELETICLKALAREKKDRYATAAELESEVSLFLEGTRERERREKLAAEQVERARLEIGKWRSLAAEAGQLGAEAAEVEKTIPRHAGCESRRALWELQDRATACERDATEALSSANAAVSSALALLPDHAEAKRLRATLAWERFLEAEAAGDRREMILQQHVVERDDDGEFEGRLRGTGTLEVRTRVWTCGCLREGRRVAPEELNNLGYHPWSGARLDGIPVNRLEELEPAETLTLRVHRPDCKAEPLEGAEVWAWRYEESDRLLVPETPARTETGPPAPPAALDALFGSSLFRPRGPGIFLGRTPVARRPWPMGSWLLILAAPGRVPVRFPLTVGRQQDLSPDVALFAPGEIPAGFIPIPAGEFQFQGDRATPLSMSRATRFLDDYFIQPYPVTCREYRAWLDGLPREVAARHAPRGMDGRLYWPHFPDRGWVVPTAAWRAAAPAAEQALAARLAYTNADWDEDWPVFGISWEDGQRYARDLSLRTGFLLSLPHEEQWEKAARGTDGRSWPWGNYFDASLANTNESHPGGMQPAPVGAFPTDESPSGLRGAAGNATDWCLNELGERFRNHRIGRGGMWNAGKSMTFVAHRLGSIASRVNHAASFRLAAPAKLSDERKPVTY